MPQVQIIRRDRVEVVNGDGRLIDATQVTYSTATLPPAVVTLEKPDPSAAEVRDAIQADIDARTRAPGDTIDL